jgi:hypothetical protein
VLSTLLGAYAAALAPLDVLGSYVAGSVALGAFDPRTSDVDVVTVMRTMPPRARLDALHVRLSARLECVYLAEGESSGVRYQRGRRRGIGTLTAVARTEIHAHPIVLAGAPPARVIARASPDELAAEMSWNLDVYWRRQRARLPRFFFTSAVDFAVGTLARILWTLRHGTVIAKREAVRWLPSALPQAAPLVALSQDGRWRHRWRRARAVQRLIDLARYHRAPCAG